MCSWMLEEDVQGINLQNWPGRCVQVSKASVTQEHPQKPGLMGQNYLPVKVHPWAFAFVNETMVDLQ